MFKSRNFIYWTKGFSLDQLGSPFGAHSQSLDAPLMSPQESDAAAAKLFSPLNQSTQSMTPEQSDAAAAQLFAPLNGSQTLTSDSGGANYSGGNLGKLTGNPENPQSSQDTSRLSGIPGTQENLARSGITGFDTSPIGKTLNDFVSTAAGGINQVAQGERSIGQAFNPAPIPSRPDTNVPVNSTSGGGGAWGAPPASDQLGTRIIRGVGGGFDVIGGGLQAAFSPISAVVNNTPGVGQAVGYGMEKLNQGSQFAADAFKQHLGIDPNSEQGKVIDKGFNVLGQLLTMKVVGDTSEALGREGAINEAGTALEKAKASGDINSLNEATSKYEQATSAPKPTITGNVGAGLYNAAADLTKGIAGKTADLGSKMGGALADLPKTVLSQVSGLKSDTLNAAMQTPEALNTARTAGSEVVQQNIFDTVKGSIDRKISDLTETGSGYGNIRKTNTSVTIPKDFLANFLQSKGLTIEDGKISANANSAIRSPNEIARLQDLYNTYEGKITSANAFLNLRQDVGGLAKFGEGISNNLVNASKDLYSKINDIGRPQIAGLKELDTSFQPQIEELQGVKNLIYKSDGTLKDNAQNIVNNLLNKSNAAKLARLEDVSPGITQDLKILKAVQNIEKPGAFIKTLAEGGMALSGHGLALVAAHILTHPSVIIPILENYGKIAGKSSAFISDITDNIKEGLPPKGSSATFVKTALQKVNPEALGTLIQARASLSTEKQ